MWCHLHWLLEQSFSPLSAYQNEMGSTVEVEGNWALRKSDLTHLEWDQDAGIFQILSDMYPGFWSTLVGRNKIQLLPSGIGH